MYHLSVFYLVMCTIFSVYTREGELQFLIKIHDYFFPLTLQSYLYGNAFANWIKVPVLLLLTSAIMVYYSLRGAGVSFSVCLALLTASTLIVPSTLLLSSCLCPLYLTVLASALIKWICFLSLPAPSGIYSPTPLCYLVHAILSPSHHLACLLRSVVSLFQIQFLFYTCVRTYSPYQVPHSLSPEKGCFLSSGT